MQNQKTFTKQPLSIEAQVSLLLNRGLVISDIAHAKHCLQTVSYYRLSGYFKPFQTSAQAFHKNTTFEQIWDVYVFDRELRLLFLDSLERIEIAFRTAMSNHMSLTYGASWYLSSQCFTKKWSELNTKTYNSPSDYFKIDVNHICKEQKEEFIKHYYMTYHHPTYPPSWMIIECLSFGKCNSLFRNLAKVSDKAKISAVFGYHPKVVESCLEALRYTRNICAHHGRLWNRWFVLIPKAMRAFENTTTKPRSLHQQLIILQHLHQAIAPNSHWQDRLLALFKKHQKYLPFHLMGFQKDWQNDPFWKL